MAINRRGFLKALFAVGISATEAANCSSFIVPTHFFNKRFGIKIPLATGWEILTFYDRDGRHYFDPGGDEKLSELWSAEAGRAAMEAEPEGIFILGQVPKGTCHIPGEFMENISMIGMDSPETIRKMNEEGADLGTMQEVIDRLRNDPLTYFNASLPCSYRNYEVTILSTGFLRDDDDRIVFADYVCHSQEGKYPGGVAGRVYAITDEEFTITVDYARPQAAKSRVSEVDDLLTRCEFFRD